MKTIKFIGTSLICAILFTSCETQVVGEIFNGGQTLVDFNASSVDFPVEINSVNFEESVDVQIDATTLSSQDRTFNVTVIDAESTADAVNYQVPGSVTIPANSYNGILTLTGQDVNLDTNPTTIVLQIEDTDDILASDAKTTVNIFQVCPVDDTFFTGDYQMTHLVFNGFGVPTFGFAKIVTLVNDNGDTARSFDAPYAPDLGAFSTVTWNFTLSCNEVAWAADQDALVGCGGAANGNIELTAPDAAFGNGTYDPLNDASFTMNFVDDNTDDCGARTNVSILMTKQ